MDSDFRKKTGLLLVTILPALFWVRAAKIIKGKAKSKKYLYLVLHTHENSDLLWALAEGLVLAFLLIYLLYKFSTITTAFEGAYFNTFLRGTCMVSSKKLAKLTKEKKNKQITIAGIPVPTRIENLHFLIGGSTGSGKTVLIREIIYNALMRFDRMIITDPDGEMLAKFFQKQYGDVILNPYDVRTQGWSFFNEIRNEYDFKRYALSIVPRGKTREAEEWASYARLLLRETARKLFISGNPSMHELFRLTTIAPAEELKEFLSDTDAASLFVGADKALASARFILSDKLPEHVNMPQGDFSLRKWLEESKSGSLYITWREDMAESLRPLISSWIDVLCSSILSLPDKGTENDNGNYNENKSRKIWMVLDELASLEKLASLESALTKGRKKGLRVVAGLQSTAQLEDIYGTQEAQVLRGCFRSLVVLGGAKTDPKTCEEMSRSLGEHEVERDKHVESSGKYNNSTSSSIERNKERVVLPSQIASLPPLTGYIAFAGNYPISKFTISDIMDFSERLPRFEEKKL